MMPSVQLAVQYATPYETQLSVEQLQKWVNKAVTEVVAIYTSYDEPPPFKNLMLTLRLVDAEEMTSLNQQFRQKAYPTNVLTFEYGVDEDGNLASDIILCVPTLEQEAQEQQKPVLHHAAHLCVHGVLHALGYDHIDDEDAEEMEGLEADILATFAIPNPYL